MPFCIEMPNIYVTRTVSAKTCVPVLPRGWGFRAYSHIIFCSGGRSFAAFFARGWGFCALKKISRGSAGGMLTSGIDLIHKRNLYLKTLFPVVVFYTPVFQQ